MDLLLVVGLLKGKIAHPYQLFSPLLVAVQTSAMNQPLCKLSTYW
jgi:hypothetical protein